MEEKARGKVKVKPESSHPHTWEKVGSSPRGSKVARERFVWSPDQRYQCKGHLCAGNRQSGGECMAGGALKETQTHGSRWLSLAPLLPPTWFILVYLSSLSHRTFPVTPLFYSYSLGVYMLL